MKYANMIGYSDVHPCEVVRKVSDKTLEIRWMDSERDKSVELEFIPGGFTAHCVNNEDQKWIYTSNEENPIIRIRLSKNRGWQDKYGQRYQLADAPHRFHDYNF